LLTLKLHVPDYKYGRFTTDSQPRNPEAQARIKLFQEIEARLNVLPGVESAAVAARLPVIHGPNLVYINIEGRAPSANPAQDCTAMRRWTGLSCHGVVGVNRVSLAYFRTLGIRLIRGRFPDERDTTAAPMTALISETAARQYWPQEDPLGKRLTLDHTSWFPTVEIIGVVADIKTNELNQPAYPEIYTPMAQLPSDDGQLILRTRTDPTTLLASVREELGRIDRDMPLRAVNTMEGVIAETLWRARLSAWLLGLFAALAAALAAAGLYGVLSYAVSQRTPEVGLRLALGAQAGDVLRMVLGEGFKLAIAGLALGLVAAFAVSRLLASQLFGVTPTDPLTYAGVALLLIAVALVACWIPARRATKVDPLVALRHE
jgi:putative ABC transport system permease protein